ncbi:nucleoside hydrolase [Eremomyces bilateralis CBS 781.70]|uniref:Nucleoside hydrolase n=1 Tax=Eremomyces bilateralis CBS 781.70 TaxID=1392243 RepID=A0A6G1GEF3_9PEZI|nr:nucleoside hydrolase [Eremomyces bilateralis CBS 781.70]KAF1816404.1 nucleoside hydrolase [Eremomyces bilateralis CBS 781.70]
MSTDAWKKAEQVFQGRTEDGDSMPKIPLWLDCDTGHDDAFAILLAAHSPAIKLLGVSTVHGNASLGHTTENTIAVLEAIGKQDIPVCVGAAKPFCRDAVHAGTIHGESGLEGSELLPKPVTKPWTTTETIQTMYKRLKATPKGTAYVVATGTLTNVALLFSVYPDIVDHIKGLSIMGGAIGGLFTNAPMGRIKEDRVLFTRDVHEVFDGRLPDEEGMSLEDVVLDFRQKGLLHDGDSVSDERIRLLLEQARRRFGNWTEYAEFNIYCDPESAASIFTNPKLAAKTDLITLDLSHQVLATPKILELLLYGRGGDPSTTKPSNMRIMFHELLTFFANTYETEFGMKEGPPLHDPLAVAVALAPFLFNDNKGERFSLHVVRGEDNGIQIESSEELERPRAPANAEQCGRTVIQPVKDASGVRIPRSCDVETFWLMLELALQSAEKVSPLGSS